MSQHIPSKPRTRRWRPMRCYDKITVALAVIATLAAMLLASPNSHATPVTGGFAQVGVTA